VVLVGGWNQPAFWQAAAWARAARRPLVVWVESTARDERSGARPLELAKRLMLRTAAGFVVPGRAAADYLVSLGADRSRIAVAPNAVDLTLFEEGVARERERRDELRREHSLPRCTFLCVSRRPPQEGGGLL